MGDPLRQVRELAARVAQHRELLELADALTPGDRALVVALARRLAVTAEGGGALMRAAAETATDGRVAVPAHVGGFRRRQRCGPDGAERRWIYVEGYDARRWVTRGKP